MIGIAHGKRGKHKHDIYIDKDVKGEVIESRHKETHSTEIDGDSRFCGKRFFLKAKRYGDKRCLYCGEWFHWKDTDVFIWQKNNNIDPYNVDDVIEPLHCGSDHCNEYHHLCAQHNLKRAKRMAEENEEKHFELFKDLKKKGIL